MHKEKKNIVADPVYTALVGRRVKLSTIRTDYDDVLIIQFDQYTLIVEIDGEHLLISKSAVIDIVIPDDLTDNILKNISDEFKRIEYKKEKIRQPISKEKEVEVTFKKKRVILQNT